jgi:hypothetical protein
MKKTLEPLSPWGAYHMNPSNIQRTTTESQTNRAAARGHHPAVFRTQNSKYILLPPKFFIDIFAQGKLRCGKGTRTKKVFCIPPYPVRHRKASITHPQSLRERPQRAASAHTLEVIPPTAEPRRNAHRGIHGHVREFNGIGGSGERLRKACPPGTDNGKS